MSNKFFVDSMFVSYIKGIPSNERIPYLQGESLTQEIVNRLIDQILSGIVCSVQLDDETKENSLVADFREGWSTVYIVKECENYYEFVNDQFPTCETQLNITGDGPRKKNVCWPLAAWTSFRPYRILPNISYAGFWMIGLQRKM